MAHRTQIRRPVHTEDDIVRGALEPIQRDQDFRPLPRGDAPEPVQEQFDFHVEQPDYPRPRRHPISRGVVGGLVGVTTAMLLLAAVVAFIGPPPANAPDMIVVAGANAPPAITASPEPAPSLSGFIPAQADPPVVTPEAPKAALEGTVGNQTESAWDTPAETATETAAAIPPTGLVGAIPGADPADVPTTELVPAPVGAAVQQPLAVEWNVPATGNLPVLDVPTRVDPGVPDPVTQPVAGTVPATGPVPGTPPATGPASATSPAASLVPPEIGYLLASPVATGPTPKPIPAIFRTSTDGNGNSVPKTVGTLDNMPVETTLEATRSYFARAFGVGAQQLAATAMVRYVVNLQSSCTLDGDMLSCNVSAPFVDVVTGISYSGSAELDANGQRHAMRIAACQNADNLWAAVGETVGNLAEEAANAGYGLTLTWVTASNTTVRADATAEEMVNFCEGWSGLQ